VEDQVRKMVNQNHGKGDGMSVGKKKEGTGIFSFQGHQRGRLGQGKENRQPFLGPPERKVGSRENVFVLRENL
jgi:hypothetical protein